MLALGPIKMESKSGDQMLPLGGSRGLAAQAAANRQPLDPSLTFPSAVTPPRSSVRPQRRVKPIPSGQTCFAIVVQTHGQQEGIHSAPGKPEALASMSTVAAATTPRNLQEAGSDDMVMRPREAPKCRQNPVQPSGHQVGASLAELPLVPWRLPGKPCPVCKQEHCRPEDLYVLTEVPAFDMLDGRIKKHVLDNLYEGDVQPLSHNRLEITRSTGLLRTIYYRGEHWHCVECSGSRNELNVCQDIATGLTWLGIMLPPKGVAKSTELVRNQAAWDLMADRWEQDYPAEVKRLVEATRRFMPKTWFNAKTDPVDRIVAMLLLTDSDTPLRYAGGKLRKWAAEGLLERSFSYGTVQATKSFPGMKQYLDNLRRSHVAAFTQLAESFGTDATGLPGGCKALYNKERSATRDEEQTRQILPEADDATTAKATRKKRDPKITVEDKPYNMVQFGFIRELRMIAEMGFFQKNLKDVTKDGVHVSDAGKIIIRGEQPWVWPMVYNAKLVHPGITEYHGDKGEFSEKLFLGGEKMGVVIDVPHKSNFKAAGSGGVFETPKAAATRKLLKDLEDPESFLDRYYTREVDEGCIGGIKREMRAWLRNIKPEHQEIEAQLMALKWNIKWGLYEKYNRRLVPSYASHATIVFGMNLQELDALALRYNGDHGWKVMLRDLNALKTSSLNVGAAGDGPGF